jgi:hypothetical protein
MTTTKPRPYAEKTKVSQDDTVKQIKEALRRRKVEGFYTGDEPGRAVIGFSHNDQGGNKRVYRFDLPMPEIEDYKITDTGHRRSGSAMIAAWEQECNRRFRALLATIKGRMISVDEGISTFEEEFAMEAVMADGRTTVRNYLLPQLEAMYATGKMPPLLPGPK